MKRLIFITILLSGPTLWADEFANGGNADVPAASKSKHGCNSQKLGASAKAGAHGTVSHFHCKSAVLSALRAAGCNVSIGGPGTFSSLSKAGKKCGHSTGTAPDGAIMMYQRGRNDRHYEIKYKGCYYSDFHHAECIPATQYHSGPFKLIGWCSP